MMYKFFKSNITVALITLMLSGQHTFAGTKKVLLIGVDGVQYDHIARLSTPAFDRLNVYKAYAGGVSGFRSEQPTVSGPGWTTIMTGVWKNKHGVSGNSDGPANTQWRSVFRYIYEADTSAKIYSFSTWGPINTEFFPHDLALMTGHYEGGGDEGNFSRTLAVLRTGNPDFIFLHLDEPDGAGHEHGFGSEYDASIVRSDTRIGGLLDEIEVREQQLGEQWLVLVVTDHGRDASGRGHGNQTQGEKTIFVASNKLLNSEYQQLTVAKNSHYQGLYQNPGQTFVVPTILQFMGIWSHEHMRLDGLPLLGSFDVKRIYSQISGNKCGFEWDSDSGTPATLGTAEHVAKFDCSGSADPLILSTNKVYANIYGTGCGLQWDADTGTPATLAGDEHVAKFDCIDAPDPLVINQDSMSAGISESQCGFQWDSDAGTPLTLGANEHVAKFDCAGTGDPISIE